MAELNIAQFVERPPRRWYEIRTAHGEAYQAKGDVIESGDGWLTLWADALTIALRVPEASVRAVRQVDPDAEAEALAETARRCLDDERAPLKKALERVQNVPTEPEVMNSEQERPDIWLHGYKCGVLAAKSAARPREETS